MTTLLPKDLNDTPIPAVRLKPGGAHTVSAGATSVRNSAAFDPETRIISLYADVPAYIAFGDATVTASASDHFFPAGLYYDLSIGGDETAHYTHIAVIQAGTAGTVYISEKE